VLVSACHESGRTYLAAHSPCSPPCPAVPTQYAPSPACEFPKWKQYYFSSQYGGEPCLQARLQAHSAPQHSKRDDMYREGDRTCHTVIVCVRVIVCVMHV
jgi:hypothetical protein